ncbi:MAG: hypothetical protein NT175_09915 [Bacteroidetes bacterium]|nr:hypothetical protein [Bacteroidota bacterium]
MSTKELKELLHESIENIDDNDFLLAVREFLEFKYKPTVPPVLSDHQIERIAKSKKQIVEGHSMTNDEADKLVEKWLSE